MGFSVSGSFAILALTAFVAIGILYPTVSTGVDQISRAQKTAGDNQLIQQNTEIAITQATTSGIFTNALTIEVENTGTSVLELNETDVLVDNHYFLRSDFTTEHVITNGGTPDDETDLWQPGETYHIEITESVLSEDTEYPPDRVKIVSGPGVSDTAEVS